MKIIKFYIVVIVFVISVLSPLKAQGISSTVRTPEEEAARQTEKLQKELTLTSYQAKIIYEINLKYARERKNSNKRAEAINRIKMKNEEIGRVLNQSQNEALRSKRTRIRSVEIAGEEHQMRTNYRPQTDVVLLRRELNSRNNQQLQSQPFKLLPHNSSRSRDVLHTRQPLHNIQSPSFYRVSTRIIRNDSDFHTYRHQSETASEPIVFRRHSGALTVSERKSSTKSYDEEKIQPSRTSTQKKPSGNTPLRR